GRVVVEADQRTVRTTHALGGADHDGVVDLALLDLAAGNRVADRNLDDIADAGVAALGAAQHLDAHQFARTAVVRRGQHGLHLDHVRRLLIPPRAPALPRRANAWSWTAAGIRQCAPGRPRDTRPFRRARAACSNAAAACRTGRAAPGVRSPR